MSGFVNEVGVLLVLLLEFGNPKLQYVHGRY